MLPDLAVETNPNALAHTCYIAWLQPSGDLFAQIKSVQAFTLALEQLTRTIKTARR